MVIGRLARTQGALLFIAALVIGACSGSVQPSATAGSDAASAAPPAASAATEAPATSPSEAGNGDKTLTLGYIGWDESIAVANLTKLVLEEQLGYKQVELKLGDVGVLFQGVGTGDLAAFQDVWMPNHQQFVDKVKDTATLLPSWFEGTTQFSLAAPAYMNISDIAGIATTGATKIYGIEPGAVIMDKIQKAVIPDYGLKVQLVESSTPAMLAQVAKVYPKQDPFVFVAWSPHWMNAEYEFNYLADPKGSLGNLTDPSQLTTIVNNDLQADDPVAYAFLAALRLTDDAVNEMEAEITAAGDPVEGVRAWLAANADVVAPWVAAAEAAG
jgi:glycine betaine/proline transport system substrate-binding protein